MIYTVKCWNGISPSKNEVSVEIEADNPKEAEAKAIEHTGMERARAKVNSIEVI